MSDIVRINGIPYQGCNVASWLRAETELLLSHAGKPSERSYRRSRPIALFGIRLFSGSDMMMTKLSAAMPALASQNDLLDSTSGIYWEWPRLQPSSVEFLDRSIEFMSDLPRYLETIVVFICYTNFFLDNDPLVIIIRVGFIVRGITNSLRKQISLKYKKSQWYRGKVPVAIRVF